MRMSTSTQWSHRPSVDPLALCGARTSVSQLSCSGRTRGDYRWTFSFGVRSTEYQARKRETIPWLQGLVGPGRGLRSACQLLYACPAQRETGETGLDGQGQSVPNVPRVPTGWTGLRERKAIETKWLVIRRRKPNRQKQTKRGDGKARRNNIYQYC